MRPFRFLLAVPVALVLVHCSSDGGEDASSSSAPLEACVADFSATWQQRSGANEWWVEYGITGATIAKAHLEVVSTGAIVPLTLQWGKWIGPSARIPTGSLVIVHAETATGKKAQTKPFGYLVVTAPVTDPCTTPTDAGTDSGDAGTCTNAWVPTWSQGSGANAWWVEYAISGTVKSASLEVVGLGDIPLSQNWGKWMGSSPFAIPSGAQVIVHATNTAGQTAETVPFRYLVDTKPATKPCTIPDGGADSGADGGGPLTAADVYDPNKVLTYELGFDAAAHSLLATQSTDEAVQKTWVHATLKVGDITFADVGVRRKGHSTYRVLPQKAAFKIRLDKYVKGQTFLGFTDLTLNNGVSDPTFLAERLSYHVFRSVGLPAQRAVSAQVKINGEPWGLYVNVETPNKQLIARLYGANAKTLYEIDWGSEWLPNHVSGFSEEVGDGTFADLDALVAAHAAAQNASLLSDMSGVLDTNEWLRFSATEAAVGHYDGYAYGIWGSHNYFMAGDTTGHFTLIPWSTDLTMSDRESVVNADVPLGAGGGPTMLVRCKATTSCWNAYKAQVKSVLATYDTLGLVNLAQTWHAQVHPLVLADPKKEASISYYTQETAKLYTWLGARSGVVRGQMGITP